MSTDFNKPESLPDQTVHHGFYSCRGLIFVRLNPLAFDQAVAAKVASVFLKHGNFPLKNGHREL